MPIKKRLGQTTLGLSLVILLAGFARPQILKTPVEEAGYTAYSQNEDIAKFLSLADVASKEMAVRIVGRTKDVEDYPAHDIFLCILTEEGADSPTTLNREKPTLLLTASQHGNEQSAKEAALRLIRDIAFGDLMPLLKKINVLVIPQANPYGNFHDGRENEIELDLNRDHVKMEAESVKAIHRVFRAWMPEMTIDVHEKGDDYYRVSIGCVSNVNIAPGLQEFSRKTLLGEVETALQKQKLTFHEYLVTEDLGVDTSSGAKMPESAARGNVEEMKRYSTTDLNDGRNSLGIYETLSFIQEGASRHDIETLEARSRWQYFGIRSLAESAAAHAGEILKLVREDRARLLERAGARAADDLVHLRMEYVRDPEIPELVLKRFERSESPVRGILLVDKKAGEALTSLDIAPNPTPVGLKIVTEIVKNWFPNVAPRLSVSRPAGYIIPAGRQAVIQTLLDHGIEVELFTKDGPLEVEAYTITDLVPSEEDYLAPKRIAVEKKTILTIIRKGDYFVSCLLPGANLIPALLEPQSDYGLIRYWRYKLVPEKGEIFAFYRMAKTPGLPMVPYKRWELGY
jgi:hypothetical protein